MSLTVFVLKKLNTREESAQYDNRCNSRNSDDAPIASDHWIAHHCTAPPIFSTVQYRVVLNTVQYVMWAVEPSY